jgi:hypothetical protein
MSPTKKNDVRGRFGIGYACSILLITIFVQNGLCPFDLTSTKDTKEYLEQRMVAIQNRSSVKRRLGYEAQQESKDQHPASTNES